MQVLRQRHALAEWLRVELVQLVHSAGGSLSERALRDSLQEIALGEATKSSALAFIEHEYGELIEFVRAHGDFRCAREVQ